MCPYDTRREMQCQIKPVREFVRGEGFEPPTYSVSRLKWAAEESDL